MWPGELLRVSNWKPNKWRKCNCCFWIWFWIGVFEKLKERRPVKPGCWRCDVLFRKCHSHSTGRVRQKGGGFLFVNQQISPVAIELWVIALQSCVPCMPCLVCSSLLQEEEKLGYYPKCCGFSWWHTSTQSTIAVQYPLPPVLILSSHICANTLLTAVCCQSAFLY